jgi:hypothetical protein
LQFCSLPLESTFSINSHVSRLARLLQQFEKNILQRFTAFRERDAQKILEKRSPVVINLNS